MAGIGTRPTTPRPRGSVLKSNLEMIRRHLEKSGKQGFSELNSALTEYEDEILKRPHDCEVIQRMSEEWRNLEK